MIKKIMILFVLLITIIAGLIGYQWLIYDKLGKTTERMQLENLEVEAEVVHKEGKLSITQNVSKLGQDSFLIEMPKGAKDFECLFANGETCDTKKESNFNRVEVGSELQVTFKYILPIAEGENEYWQEDGFVRFFSNDQKPLFGNFTVTLLEEVAKTNMWFAGALREVRVDKEHISYFAWMKKDATVFPLYMSKAQLEKDDKYDPYLSLFTSNTENKDLSFVNQWYERLPSNNGLTIVQSNGNKVYKAPLLVVIPRGYNTNAIEEQAIQAYLLHHKKPKSDKIAWILNVLPSFILERPTGAGKEFEMSKELVENLPAEVKKEFASWLLKPNNGMASISIADLDKKLSEIGGFKTIFFEKNENKNKPIIPLYYIDKRNVFYEEKEINLNWNAVEKNKALLFPFGETLENTGFEVKVLPESDKFEIMKLDKRWTLPLEEKENLLEFIGEELYISERGLEEFLKIEVIKRDGGIYLR